MTRSQEFAKILVAVRGLHATAKPVRRNRSNESFDWADLPAVLKVLRQKLKRWGLTEFQTTSGKMEGHVFMASVTTLLVHDSGEWIEDTASCPCPPDRLEYSACISLLRRVSLVCLLGLVQGEPEPQQLGVPSTSRAQRLVDARREAAMSTAPRVVRTTDGLVYESTDGKTWHPTGEAAKGPVL